MNRDRTLKFMRLALGNPNENEATVAAKRFFKQLPGRFSSREWGITGDEARRLMKLAGVQVKGGEQPKVSGDLYQGILSPMNTKFSDSFWVRFKGLREVSLKQLCEALGVTPPAARRQLRKVLECDGSWVWSSGYELEVAARIIMGYKS